MSDYTTIAKECGAREAIDADDNAELIEFTSDQLTAFADRVRDDERERCAQACEARGRAYRKNRSPGWYEVDHETAQCAAAIRSLSKKA